MTTRTRWWAEMKTADFATLDPAAMIAILPIAAVEQHGPHLPLGTDTMIAEGMLQTLIEEAGDEPMSFLALPVQTVGKSNEHDYAAGTLSLSAQLLIEAWTQIGLCVARAGIGKIVFVTSHGGNEEVMGIVARELRVRAKMLAVKSSWGRFGLPDGLISADEQRFGIHGGEVETALMLHFRPELVDMTRAENFRSSFEDAEGHYELLRPTGPFGYSWIASDINHQGVVGNATKASAETGRQIALHQVKRLLRLLRDIAKAPLFS
ncbi:creatininase family protein [Aureimonas psammosilenae]|uniref:creatininase family protein n=1 Tax=Aureimonas psammosilenae TaxID=2495496 RepID=UPI0012610527|nr:creatininase family protein [Aureimonas psammosilenae]